MGALADLTFCFTDIEGSTALLRSVGDDKFEEVLERHRVIVRAALAATNGDEVKTEGDGFFLAFDDAGEALRFAAEAQRALTAEPWPVVLRVRMGLHTGPAARRPDGDFVALAVHQAARVVATAHGGQVLLSSACAAAATDALTAERVGVQRIGAFRLRDFTDAVELFELTGAGLPSGFPPPRAAPADHGLRMPRTSLVGREREVNQLAALIAQHRFVTLVGASGVGKTRVALEAAALSAASFPDGLHVAELSVVDGPDFVDATMAGAIGVRPEPGVAPVDALVSAIGADKRLVILDSCERSIDQVALTTDRMLSGCPNIVIVATSTEPVRLPDERLLPIGPLITPAVDDDNAGMDSDAVRLLVQRAVASGAALGPTDQELAELAEIARRLDGIPLALELAAGRIAERGVSPVLAALDDRFALLTNGYRTALPRHRTLEAMVEWSMEQLKPEAADLLVAFSTLLGRWEPAAAASVCTDDPASGRWLQGLIDRSLLVVEEGAKERVRLLDTVRAYASRSLDDGARRELARRRLDWLVEHLQPLVVGVESVYVEEVDALIPDIRSALRREAGESTELASALAGFVGGWFEQRGLWREYVDVLEELAAVCPPGSARARVHVGLAQMSSMLGDQGRAREYAELVLSEPDASSDSRTLAVLAGESLGQPPPADGPDPLREALAATDPRSPAGLGARSRLALRSQILGDPDAAVEGLTSVIADARAVGRTTLAAQAHINLGGLFARLGRLDDAERELEQGRNLALERRNPSLAAGALTNLSVVALHRGDAARSLRLGEERLRLARQMGQRRGEAAALSAVSNAAAALGDLARAREASLESLALSRVLEFREGMVTCGFNIVMFTSRLNDQDGARGFALDLIGDVVDSANPALKGLALLAAGAVAASSGNTTGVELIASGASLLSAGAPLDPADREWLESCQADVTASMDDAALAEARARGEALDADDALDIARRLLGTT